MASRSLLALALLVPVIAQAEPSPDSTYAEEPTAGMSLPTSGISGQSDVLATALNPAGLQFLEGWELALALSRMTSEDQATSPGQGVGVFAGGTFGGGLLPKMGWGLGVEFLSPPRIRLAPDPGNPARVTFAQSLPLGAYAAVGFSWHHFIDDGAPLDGVDTFDLGLAMRLGAHLGLGFGVRDLTAPVVAGVPVQRRYELELSYRPTATDRLELALGGRLGEIRTDFSSGDDIDGWLRGAVRVVRGIYLRGQLETRSLFELTANPSGVVAGTTRETRLSLGLEVSFGGVSATTIGEGAIDKGGDGRLTGVSGVLRVSEVEVPSVLPRDKRIERIDLRGVVDERALTGLIAYLRGVARDDDVVAVLVNIDDLTVGWAGAGEIRRALVTIRRRGIPVYAYMVAGTTKQYFVASAANKIYLDPAGGIRLQGLFSATMYFKGLFDKLGVLAQFEKIEEYKSAPESYTRTGPTEPASTMRNEMYDSIYDHLVQAIAKGRGISPERVRVLIDNGPYTSGDLDKIPDLVDDVVTPDELGVALARELGAVYGVARAPRERRERWRYPTVAVIYIDGDIIDGKSTTVPLLNIDLVGGTTIAEAIERARLDPAVEAIVLRINSPGGSALASEIMAREVLKTRGVKPIICSMGDVAASGGYFAAAGCDYIFADPMTITGSIGIFNGKFDFSGLFAKLGVTIATYKRGAHADTDTYTRPFTEDERRMMKSKLHYFYGRFIKTVAEGRGMTTAEVDAVGRGHVYTGAQAKAVGLIDGYGGIGEAISMAKSRIGLGDRDKVELEMLPKAQSGLLSRLIGSIALSPEARAQQAERDLLGALLPGDLSGALLRAFPGSVWAQPGVPQARLPFVIVDQE